MSSMDRNVLQDDQHYETNADGAVRHQWIRVLERWESLLADGSTYCSAASREDVIFEHLHSNAHMAHHAKFMAERGEPPATHGEPLTTVRRVVRYEISSTWEVVSQTEQLDELAEIASLPPCPHPAERIQDSGSRSRSRRFCGRCGATIETAR